MMREAIRGRSEAIRGNHTGQLPHRTNVGPSEEDCPRSQPTSSQFALPLGRVARHER